MHKNLLLEETDDYIVVNKPAGLLVHPDAKHSSETLTDILKKEFPEITEVGDEPSLRPGIVHRLDKSVSGVMVVARTPEAFKHLKTQFQERKVKKSYLALVHGAVSNDDGEISTNIGRSKNGKMVARTTLPSIVRDEEKKNSDKKAITNYTVKEKYNHYTFLEIRPYTGRTHQIRVHMTSIGHPIVGDSLYSVKRHNVHEKNMRKKFPTLTERIWLHAYQISFVDLQKNEQTYTINPPDDIMKVIKYLKSR